MYYILSPLLNSHFIIYAYKPHRIIQYNQFEEICFVFDFFLLLDDVCG